MCEDSGSSSVMGGSGNPCPLTFQEALRIGRSAFREEPPRVQNEAPEGTNHDTLKPFPLTDRGCRILESVVYALIHAQGMMDQNEARRSRGEAQAYDDRTFFDVANDMRQEVRRILEQPE